MQRKLDKISLSTFQKHFTIFFYSLENLTRWCNFTKNLNLQNHLNLLLKMIKQKTMSYPLILFFWPTSEKWSAAHLRAALPRPCRGPALCAPRSARGLAAQQQQRRRGPRLSTRSATLALPRPGRNLGLGREFVAPPGPHSARRIVAIHFDRTAMRDFRGIKTPPAGRPSPNPSSFRSSFLSLRSSLATGKPPQGSSTYRCQERSVRRERMAPP